MTWTSSIVLRRVGFISSATEISMMAVVVDDGSPCGLLFLCSEGIVLPLCYALSLFHKLGSRSRN